MSFTVKPNAQHCRSRPRSLLSTHFVSDMISKKRNESGLGKSLLKKHKKLQMHHSEEERVRFLVPLFHNHLSMYVHVEGGGVAVLWAPGSMYQLTGVVV